MLRNEGEVWSKGGVLVEKGNKTNMSTLYVYVESYTVNESDRGSTVHC